MCMYYVLYFMRVLIPPRAATFIESLSYCIQYHYSVSSSRRKAFGESVTKEEPIIYEGEQPILSEFGTQSKSKAKKIEPAAKESVYQRISSHML